MVHHHPIFPMSPSLPRFFDNMTIITLGIGSSTRVDKKYTITVDTELKIVSCSCIGFQFKGRCKHVKFYKDLIKSLLHENPGVEKEKGGK